MNLLGDFTFSQSSLQDDVDCPRRFELRYLKRVRYPAPETQDMLEFEQLMQHGADFHRLIHQYILGIPAELLTPFADEAPLNLWWRHFLADGLRDVPDEKRLPEMTLIAPLGDYRLLAKYDLLAITPGERAVIMDWKTSRNLPKREWLAAKLQTHVYRYVLALAGDELNDGAAIPPDAIEMRYWYAEHNRVISFPYSEAQFAEDERYLLSLIAEIEERDIFPLTTDDRRCRFCTYRTLCGRGNEAGLLDEYETDFEITLADDFDIDLDQIAEIEF